MPAFDPRRIRSTVVLRWTAAAATASISVPLLLIWLHGDPYMKAHILHVVAAWAAAVGLLLAALRLHRARLVAELQRADDDLSTARRRFEALAAGLRDEFFLYEHDPAGVFFYLSPSLTGMLGWSTDEFKRHYTAYLTDHPVNRDVVAKTEGSLAGVQQDPYPVEVRHKDGTPRWLEVYEVPLVGPDGRVSSVLGIARDCTRERRARSELLAVRAAVDQAADAVAIAGLDGTVRFVNASWGRLHGYDPRALVGRNLSMFHTPEQLERDVRPFNETVVRDGRHSGEVGHVHRDGTVIPTWMTTALFRGVEGEPDGLIGVARDLREMRRRETMTRELLDSLDELVFTASPSGRVGFANEAWRAAVDAPAEAESAFVAESRPAFAAAFEAVLRGDAVPPLRAALKGRAGLAIPVELRLRLIRAETQAPEVRGVARDLRLSEALVAQTARAELLRSMGVFAGGVAHDFNNLLTVIMGRLSIVIEDEALAAPLKVLLEGALTSAGRASELARQLLTLAKGGVSEFRPTDVRRLLRETSEFALSGSQVVLALEAAPDLWTVDADELQLSQVVANLALNAKQAMPKGGSLTVRAANVELSAEEARLLPPLSAGRWVRIEFEDTGSGIPDDLLARIFEPYFTTKEEGSGLGLAVCFAIVDRHGGRLEAASRPGRGATFRFHLRASAPGAAPAEPAPRAAPRGRGRVVIMDDEPDVLATAALILERAGYEVLKAADGARALALAREARSVGRPLCGAVLDLSVKGGLGGSAVIGELRRDEPALPVLASTGFITPGLEKDLLNQGFTALLPKPYTGRTLARVMTALTEGRPR